MKLSERLREIGVDKWAWDHAPVKGGMLSGSILIKEIVLLEEQAARNVQDLHGASVFLDWDDWESIVQDLTMAIDATAAQLESHQEHVRKYQEEVIGKIKEQLRELHAVGCDACGAGMPCSKYPIFLRES